ncbi:hypothetical protein ACP70R_042525 [Stipagrostis hirtigluma subsp. patula]
MASSVFLVIAKVLGGNKPDALRVKQIAEEKFQNNDLAEAKKFASIAKSFYSDLEGIDQLIATIDIHLAAKRNASSYEILSVDKSVDYQTVRMRYKTLSLQLHPDKNKSVGANNAFLIVKKAYDELSTKFAAKKEDRTTSIAVSEQSTSKATTSNPATRSECDDNNSAANAPSKPMPKQQQTAEAAGNATSGPAASSNAGVQKPNSAAAGTPNSKAKEKKKRSRGSNKPPSYRHVIHRTFWTSCDKCNGKFEYHRVYKNHKIKCHICHEPFSATEILLAPAP